MNSQFAPVDWHLLASSVHWMFMNNEHVYNNQFLNNLGIRKGEHSSLNNLFLPNTPSSSCQDIPVLEESAVNTTGKEEISPSQWYISHLDRSWDIQTWSCHWSRIQYCPSSIVLGKIHVWEERRKHYLKGVFLKSIASSCFKLNRFSAD